MTRDSCRSMRDSLVVSPHQFGNEVPYPQTQAAVPVVLPASNGTGFSQRKILYQLIS